jgi:hypothetical protein
MEISDVAGVPIESIHAFMVMLKHGTIPHGDILAEQRIKPVHFVFF